MFGKLNYKKGIKLYDSKNYLNAIEKLKKAIESGDLDETETYNAYVLEGNYFIEIEYFDEAIKALISALKWNDNHFLAYRELGRAYFMKGNYEQSLHYSEIAINLNLSDYYSWLVKGWSLFKLDKYDEAERALNFALNCEPSLDPEKIDIINQKLFVTGLKKSYMISSELQNNGKYLDAINVYDFIIRSINSNSVPEFYDEVNYINADSLLNKGICLKKLKRYDSAINALKEVINIVPDSAIAYFNIADCYFESKMFDEALEYWAEAEKCTDNEDQIIGINFMKHYAIFGKLIKNKDYQAALDEVNLIPEEDDVFIYYKKVLKGICYFYLKNYDETLNYLLPYVDVNWIDNVFGNNSLHGMIYTYIGGVYYKRKNYETALKYLKKCVQFDFNELADTGLFMGESYIALGEYEKAIDALRKAVDAWKDDDDYDISYLESRIEFAKKKLAEEKAKTPPSHIIINGNNNPINLGGILATDDAVINRSVIGKDSAQEEPEFCFCPKCGTKVGTEDSFCRKCGEKLN